MKKVIGLAIVSSVFLATGCATNGTSSALSGGGSYQLTNTVTKKDGSVSTCSVKITSARDISNGNLEIGKDCALRSSVDSTAGGNAAMKAVSKALSLVPMPIPGK